VPFPLNRCQVEVIEGNNGNAGELAGKLAQTTCIRVHYFFKSERV